jgi:hypothetical protein
MNLIQVLWHLFVDFICLPDIVRRCFITVMSGTAKVRLFLNSSGRKPRAEWDMDINMKT